MLDYIIVGFGLSGLAFAEILEEHRHSFVVFNDKSQRSSRVAGGLFNPVILKRFTLAWKANEHLRLALPFYKNLEDKLNQKFIHDVKVLRRFNSIEEQNLWFQAADKPKLDQFLSDKLIPNTNEALDIPYRYGRVMETGKIDTATLLDAYSELLDKKYRLRNETFQYDALKIKEDCIEYNGIKAKHILFAEGFGLKNNPFFAYLPLYGNKGEYITIRCEKLQLEEAVKSSIFIIPLGNDLYKVGATYNNEDKTPNATSSAKEELIKKLDLFLKVEYEIIDQVAGIRPTIRDRRPVVGNHPKYFQIHILNGLGSRGVLTAPYSAKQLYNYIEKEEPLDAEIDCSRFKYVE